MADPYIGEIRMFAGNFPPAGWMYCEGQVLQIEGNESLYQLIGTQYGGDGQSTFALPDLRGRIPLHQGNNFQLAQNGGVEEVTLATSQIPSHSHTLNGSSANASEPNPGNNVLATSTIVQAYAVESVAGGLAPGTIGAIGGSQPHTNLQPYLCVNFIIALMGIYPQQN